MTIRLEMIRTAARAPRLLGDSAYLVAGFIAKKINEDGGFKGRSEKSDLYYTLFAVEALIALNAPLHAEHIAAYLKRFGAGDGLDLVHLACLARCWANIAESQNCKIQTPVRDGILQRIQACRSADGAFSNTSGAPHGTVYASFLALGAYQDLNADMDNAAALADCAESLRTPDGAYSNDPTMQVGATPPTAAALTILHYLGKPVPKASTDWLLSQLHPKGGFVAVPVPGSFGMPDLLSTATALHALALAGVSTAGIAEKCLDFLDSLWSAEGAFSGSGADPILDCEYTYYGLLSLGHLSADAEPEEDVSESGNQL